MRCFFLLLPEFTHGDVWGSFPDQHTYIITANSFFFFFCLILLLKNTLRPRNLLSCELSLGRRRCEHRRSRICVLKTYLRADVRREAGCRGMEENTLMQLCIKFPKSPSQLCSSGRRILTLTVWSIYLLFFSVWEESDDETFSTRRSRAV